MIDIERFSEAARFVSKSVENGAHLSPPKHKGRENTWERNVDITLTYLFGMEAGKDNTRHISLQDVAEVFLPNEGEPKKRRERIRQIVKKTVSYLRQNSPQQLQSEYPLERLEKQLGKPGFLTRPEGITRSVLEDLDRGMDYKSLRNKYPFSSLDYARWALDRYGIDVPCASDYSADLIREMEQAGPETDNDVLKQILGKITRSFQYNHWEIYDQHCVALSKLLRQVGFYFHNTELSIFLDRLAELDMALGHIVQLVKNGSQKGERPHYFVFRFQEESIARALLPNPSLARFLQNPVRQTAGVSLLDLPSVDQMRNSGYYRSVLSLCRQMGIRVGGYSPVQLDDLLKGSLVPVIEYRYFGKRSHRILRYPAAAEDMLKSFLLQKATRLGLVKPA